MTDISMFVRYMLMIGVGHLVTSGYIESSSSELFVGAGLALFTVAWKYIEKYVQSK